MEQTRRTSDFTQGSILQKLLRFMVPVLGALILQAMYGAVDIWVVGKFGTTAGISGVSTGSNIVNLVTFTVTGLSMGITVLIGRYLGRGTPGRVGKVIGGAVCFFAVVSVVLAAALVVFARPLALLMQAPAEAVDLTATYVRICGGGIVFIVAYNVISSIFRGLGNSKLPLLFVAIACAVNIVGDLFFVAVLHMNVAGAALATVMAQAVSVVLSLAIIRLQEILTNLSFLALCAFINRLGLEASSGYGVANKIVSFVMLVPSALMQSMSAFVAQNVGAGREDRTRKALFLGMAMGCAVGVVIGGLSYFQGDLPSAIFADDPAVILRSAEYLKGFAPEAVVTCILFSFMGYFNGHSQTLFVMIQGLAQTFLVRLPMSYLMSIQPDASLTMIGLAAPSATVFGILVNLVFYLWYIKRGPGAALGRGERL